MSGAGETPAGFKGKLNIYVCEKCRGHIVTRDRDPGVTPFMLACKARLGCGGLMRSSMYRVFDQTMAEGWEWYAPSAPEIARLSAFERNHVSNGGLLLRKANPE